MKKSRRITALLLILTLLCTLFTGCRKKAPEIASPDQVAAAIFDLVIHNDASTAQQALGYKDEADVRADFLGSDEDFYTALADELIAQFEEIGANVSPEDGKLLLEGFLAMMNKVQFSAQVKSMDQEAGTAVVTCAVSAFEENALSNAVTGAMLTLLADEDLLADPDALVSALIRVMAETMDSLEPTGDVRSFDVDFTLEQVTIDGRATAVWVPVDAEAFGASISNAAMGS